MMHDADKPFRDRYGLQPPIAVFKFIGGPARVYFKSGFSRTTWYGHGADSGLRPLPGVTDEHAVASWADCPWQPERVGVSADER